MARKLIVEIIGDASRLIRSFNQSTTAANRFGTQVAGSASKAERSMAKFQRVAAGAFVGSAALGAGAIALRRVFDAAAESQQVLGQTQVALESTGKSWEQYGQQIQDAVAQQSRMGFDDEALLQSFSLFIRQSDNVGEALRRNNIAMDVARARFMDLEQAAKLVNKAALGQAGALRRVGIDAREGASGVELLAQLERQFGGAAEAASTQAIGATDRLKVSLENVEEAIGKGLLPIVSEMAGAMSDTADSVTILIEKLGALGSIKIPVIDIPFNFTVPGTGGDSALETWFKRFSPAGVVFNTADLLGLVADQFKKGAKPDNAAAAKLFDDQFQSFEEGLAKGADTAAKRRPKAFGEKGFKAVANNLSESQAKAFEATMDALSLKLDRAQLSKATSDDLGVLAEIERVVRAQISVHGRTTELMRMLFEVDQERAAIAEGLADEQAQSSKRTGDKIEKAARLRAERLTKATQVQAEAREKLRKLLEGEAAKEQASQFRAIGLSATGGDIIPGVANLRKQLDQLSKSVVGQDVPKKLLDRLALVRKALAGGIKNITPETREEINNLFSTIRGTFSQEMNKGIVAPRHVQISDQILAALGFDKNMDVPRLSGLGRGRSATARAAVTGMTVTGPITVVANNPDAFLRDLQKKAGRTTATARGRFPGRSLGLG